MLLSVDFADIEQLQREARWDQAVQRLADEAGSLVSAGAELLVLCTNTMHKIAGAISEAVSVPLVHIADATAEAVRASGLEKVRLLATAYTMEQDFYVGRLRDQHGLDVLVPNESDRQIVHRVIYDELCVGVVRDDSRSEYRRIMTGLVARGAGGILLGCTEIDLLVAADDATVSLFDKDPTYVMQQLGHTDPACTLRVYSHMMRRSEDEREALKALVEGRVLAGNSQGTPDPAPHGTRDDRF